MTPWLFNVCIYMVWYEVNARLLRKEMELLRANGERFKICADWRRRLVE